MSLISVGHGGFDHCGSSIMVVTGMGDLILTGIQVANLSEEIAAEVGLALHREKLKLFVEDIYRLTFWCHLSGKEGIR